MGFDLVRGKACISFNCQTWWEVITLAVGHGWEPTGTGPPRGTKAKDWPGFYLSNDGQLLYARDGKRMADALERALSSPDASSIPGAASRVSRWLGTVQGRQALDAKGLVEEVASVFNPTESGEGTRGASPRQPWVLSEDGKSCLRDFITFCRGGSFRIY